MNIFTFFLVFSLLIADALIFFVAGYTLSVVEKIRALKEKGWIIEPPKDETRGVEEEFPFGGDVK